MWLPVPHDEGANGTLAHLDAEPNRLAGVAADRSQPFELPLKLLLGGRVVGVAAASFCLSPSRASAALYEVAVAARFSAAFPSADPLWSARTFARLVLSGALPPQVVRLAFLLRALDLQGNPRAWQGPYAPL